jgi:hypothetical protein
MAWVIISIPTIGQETTVDYPAMGTAIVQTATAEATGNANAQTEQSDTYALTATQLVTNATATSETWASSQSDLQTPMPPIWLIVIGIASVIIALIVYNRMKTDGKQKRKR